MRAVIRDEMTSREYQQHEWDVEARRETFEQQVKLKQMDVELARLDAKWSSWLKLPLRLIMLPVYLLFGVGYCIHAITKKEPPENFWKLMR